MLCLLSRRLQRRRSPHHAARSTLCVSWFCPFDAGVWQPGGVSKITDLYHLLCNVVDYNIAEGWCTVVGRWLAERPNFAVSIVDGSSRRPLREGVFQFVAFFVVGEEGPGLQPDPLGVAVATQGTEVLENRLLRELATLVIREIALPKSFHGFLDRRVAAGPVGLVEINSAVVDFCFISIENFQFVKSSDRIFCHLF
jgi:hypothetical protein